MPYLTVRWLMRLLAVLPPLLSVELVLQFFGNVSAIVIKPAPACFDRRPVMNAEACLGHLLESFAALLRRSPIT